MYRILFLFFFFLQTLVLQAVSYKSPETDAYIQKYHKIAIRHMKQYRIPASITLAQGILESGSGRSKLAVKANNHFGIKCKDDYKGKKYYKTDDKRHECFRKYASAEESYEDHALFLAERKIYAPLFQYKVTEYKKWAKGLKKCGYATSSTYPSRLIAVIEQNKLYLFDQQPDKYLDKDDVKPVDDKTDDGSKSDDANKNDKTVNGNNPPKVTNGKLAGVKCVVVAKGNTFYSLARAAGVSVADLYKYNDVDASHILHPGEVLFVAKKNSRYTGAKLHTVEVGDTPWSIAQKYAITLKDFQKLNSLSAKSVLRVGQKLKLQK